MVAQGCSGARNACKGVSVPIRYGECCYGKWIIFAHLLGSKRFSIYGLDFNRAVVVPVPHVYKHLVLSLPVGIRSDISFIKFRDNFGIFKVLPCHVAEIHIVEVVSAELYFFVHSRSFVSPFHVLTGKFEYCISCRNTIGGNVASGGVISGIPPVGADCRYVMFIYRMAVAIRGGVCRQHGVLLMEVTVHEMHFISGAGFYKFVRTCIGTQVVGFGI